MEAPSAPSKELELQGGQRFNQFDVVSDHSDHYFVNSLSNCKKAHKKIMQEWRILEKNLPESIYVRVYENRIDLLRALIVGAAGTPYHDGLFFFDFAFPANYPSLPPRVYYRSCGLRINPNLYVTGHVCLSLLNTWRGQKCEKWNPSQSTILQILLSIQALVLNKKPYFNEPSAIIRGGSSEKKSLAYNDLVFALSCRTMLYLNRNPPRNFEILISRHFLRRGSAILMACKAYVNGEARVGYFGESPAILKVSTSFKVVMNELYPKLVAVFKMNGASIQPSIEQLMVTEKKNSSESSSASEKKDSFAKKVIRKIRKILGFKNKMSAQKIEAN